MSRQSIAQAALDDFGTGLGVGPLALDAEGRVTLEIGSLEVTFSYEHEPTAMVWLYADLGEVADGEEAPRTLLRLAFVTWVASSMTIAVPEGSGRAVGYACIPVTMLTADALHRSFTRLTNAALEVRRVLETGDVSVFDQLATGAASSTDQASNKAPGMRV